ncbi:putative tetraheme cytochrome-c type [Rhodospirillaceae bacterium LM-1]|nr:putative tetraheme cytochrome-c type [Rhodospirillaceae bacterium LM-1]
MSPAKNHSETAADASGAAHHERHPKRPPSKKRSWCKSLGFFAIIFMAGVFGMAGFVTAIEWTNRTEFCTSCHSMQLNYDEYKESIHYKNRSGAHAQCHDCHVPKELGPKLVRKFFAVNDIIAEIKGTIDTPEKFYAKRAELADRVWVYMIKSDSRECRNCHTYDSMDVMKQSNAAKLRHPQAALEGKTCVQCHKGVAHKLPPRED